MPKSTSRLSLWFDKLCIKNATVQLKTQKNSIACYKQIQFFSINNNSYKINFDLNSILLAIL